MDGFEAARQSLFEQVARECLPLFNPQTGLMPGRQATLSSPALKRLVGIHDLPSDGDIRATVRAALAFAMSGMPAPAAKALSAVLDNQDRNPRSLTYGNFFWYDNWKADYGMAADPNAVSFFVPPLCFLLKHRESILPEPLRQRTREALELALTGLGAHRATWGYTNIALLNMAAKLMIADVLDDPRAEKLVCWDWEEWRNHTARIGMITEYNSIVYTMVQIDALAMMLSCERANPVLRNEVRDVMRHLITMAVLDYHPGIGRITGPQSRAYPDDRRLRGHSGMDTVLRFVLGTPEPAHGGPFWLGVPIGPEDILPEARRLSLPRTTRATTHGFSRRNDLAADFALGSVSGPARLLGHGVPFFLAHRTAVERCAVPIMPAHEPEACHSLQQDGILLAGCVWLLDRRPARQADSPYKNAQPLSGLRTGRAATTVSTPGFLPGFTLELGWRSQLRLFRADGVDIVPDGGVMPSPVMACEMENIVFALRFFGSGTSAPELRLREDDSGEVMLDVQSPAEGMPINDREQAVCCGFLLVVTSRSEGGTGADAARRMAETRLELDADAGGWQAAAHVAARTDFQLTLPVSTPCMYSWDGGSVSANEWALSLGNRDKVPDHRS